MARPWTAAESRLVSEFVTTRWPKAHLILRVRVGSIRPTVRAADLDDGELRAIGVWRRWLDGLVILPRQVYLVEGSIRPNVGKLSQLQMYMELWPSTPEFAHLAKRPAKGVLVYAVHDPAIASMARAAGFDYHTYSPRWALDYLDSLYPRDRTAGRGGG